MGFEAGNQFWKLAPKNGRKPIYESASQLLEDCLEYFEKTSQRTTWNKQHWVGKDGEEVTIKMHTPFTKSGLYVFLGICNQTWVNYKERGSDFLEVITYVEDVIVTQKLEGAMAGHFQHTIVAMELGISNKIEQRNQQLDKDGKPVDAVQNITFVINKAGE